MSFFNYHGYKIEQARIGDHVRGQTNVIYLHGFNFPFQNNMNLLEGLALEQINLWAINFPGHGNSEEIEEISWERLVDIVRAFIEERQLTDVILLGYSMGGGVSLKAIEYGIPLSAVVLLCPFTISFKLDSADPTRAIEAAREVLQQIAPTNKVNRKKPKPWTGAITYILENYVRVFTDFTVNLENNTTPIEVTIAKEDKILLPEQIKETLKDVNKVKFKEIKHQGHDIYYIDDAKIDVLISTLSKQIRKHAQIQESFWSKLFTKR